jgi:hypothetical protein
MKILLLTLALILSAHAAEPHISQKSLDKITTYWVHVLKLDDWEARTHAVKLDELEAGTLGHSTRDFELRFIEIEVLDPSEYARAATAHQTVPKTGKEIIADIKDTIVHELVHLRLVDLVKADNAHLGSAEELAVDRLTSALLRK